MLLISAGLHIPQTLLGFKAFKAEVLFSYLTVNYCYNNGKTIIVGAQRTTDLVLCWFKSKNKCMTSTFQYREFFKNPTSRFPDQYFILLIIFLSQHFEEKTLYNILASKSVIYYSYSSSSFKFQCGFPQS